MQILHDVETISSASDEHPLALLAEKTKKLLKKDTTIFMPILSQRHSQATVISASLLHKLYGIKLVSKYLSSMYIICLCTFIYFIWRHESLIKYHFFQKPFLDGAEHLTEDVVSVFPAADSLEQYVLTLIMSSCEEGIAESYCRKLNLYKVCVKAEKRRELSSPSIFTVFLMMFRCFSEMNSNFHVS